MCVILNMQTYASWLTCPLPTSNPLRVEPSNYLLNIDSKLHSPMSGPLALYIYLKPLYKVLASPITPTLYIATNPN